MKTAKRMMRFDNYVDIYLLMLSFLFFAEEIGFYYSPINRVCGSFIFITYGIKNYGNWRPQTNIKSKLRFGMTIILSLLAFISPLPVMSIGFALCATLCWRGGLKVEVFTGVLFFIYCLLKNYFPYFYYLESGVADCFNSILKFFTAFEINYSATAYGLGWFLIIMIVCLTQIWTNKLTLFKKVVLIIQPIFGYFVLHVLYHILSIEFQTLPRPSGYGLDYYFYYLAGHFLPMNGHILLFTILFVVTAAGHGFLIKQRPVKRIKSKPTVQMLVVFLVLNSTFVLVNTYWNLYFEQEFNDGSKRKIYVQDTQMDFITIPNDQVWGVRNGLFGMLFSYLDDLGYHCQFSVDWDQINPTNHDVIMMINPHGKLETTERDRLLSFIKQGGSLFLLGDHTHMFGLENDYFAFTKELGISFNFDTAMYFRLLWKYCLRSPFMTWDLLLRREDYLSGIVQGASLELKFPAQPLIIGAYGWSDAGDLENEAGYLGNRRYEAHEPTGDVVLAATRNYGKGKLMVFGDTSFLQNSPLSSAYPLLQLCLSQLEPKNNNAILLIIPLFFLLAGLLVACRKINKKYKIAILVFLTTSLLLNGALIGGDQGFVKLPPKTGQVRAGINRFFFPTYYDSDWGVVSKGIGGLKNTIMREKILPYELYVSGANIYSTDILFLLAPQEKIPSNEVQNLLEYIRKGGLLIVAAGYEHKNQVEELCTALGVEISNMPYSYLAGEQTNLGIRFVSAWPLEILGSKEQKIICETWDQKPLIIEIIEGQGKALIIGDSYFFENRNLEDNELYYKNNMEFVRKLLSEFYEGN